MTGDKFRNIEAGRGIAAMLVVFYHVDKYYFASIKYWHDSAFGGLFVFGHSGVEFFFVLSGLLITKIHFDDIGKPARLGNFVRKRVARIYPFYWFCTALLLAAVAIMPAAAPDFWFTPARLALSLSLVGNNPHASFLFVSWTLFHEMLFYAVFALLIWQPRIGIPVAALWFGACALLGIRDADIFYPLQFINLLFGFGIAAGIVTRRPVVPWPHAMAIAGIALFLLCGIDEAFWHLLPRPAGVIAYGLGATLALVGLVELERRGRFAAPGWLVLAGQASYAIYLTHMLSLPVAAKLAVAGGAPGWLPVPIAFAALSLAAIAAGIAIHLVAERPILRWSRRALTRPAVRAA